MLLLLIVVEYCYTTIKTNNTHIVYNNFTKLYHISAISVFLVVRVIVSEIGFWLVFVINFSLHSIARVVVSICDIAQSPSPYGLIQLCSYRTKQILSFGELDIVTSDLLQMLVFIVYLYTLPLSYSFASVYIY